MLSRLALRKAQALPAMACGVANSTSTSSTYIRPVRPEYPSPVRHGFIPEEWFTFFYPKTGVTGPYMFAVSLSTYLISKEIYILEHEFYNGLSLAIVLIVGIKKLGPKVAAFLDKRVDDFENQLNKGRLDTIKNCEDLIEHNKTEQWRTEAQKLIVDVKRENIKMQLEAAYRERIAKVYSEVKKRLDYQLQTNAVERRIAQKHMVQWIINNVLKAITPDQEKANLQQCIKDLEGLAQKA